MEWTKYFDIQLDYVSGYGGDIDVYVIQNKISGKYIESAPGVTWFSYGKPDAIAMAQTIHFANEEALEEHLLGQE